MLSEIAQTEKDKYCIISLTCRILKNKFREQKWVGEMGEGGQKVQLPVIR